MQLQGAAEPNEPAAAAKEGFVLLAPPSLSPLHPRLHKLCISLAAYSASAQKLQLGNTVRTTTSLFTGERVVEGHGRAWLAPRKSSMVRSWGKTRSAQSVPTQLHFHSEMKEV